ncbi:MAG: tyrosine-type recombinase/integrase [Chloroflexia bacterium]
MRKQKWRNRTLERGVVIDRARGYVYVRFTRQGLVRKELIGRTTDADAIDRANFRAQQIRHRRRADGSEFEPRRGRLLMEDAADLFLKLHGEKRQSAKGAKQFIRYTRLIKEAWSGRYADTMTGDDMRDYRDGRRKQGVAESTINREQTAIITMFNKLVEWRRVGQIPRNILLPDGNPARGVKKVNEDRFIRERLLSDEEYKNLWACADQRTRRIILAAMNLPLRLEDLKQLDKKNINYKLGRFKGVQAKTGKEYSLPINEVLWDLIKTAPVDRILDFTGFGRRWPRVVKRAGLKGLQFRDLRRTAATALHDGGEKLRTISAMLGHGAVTTTIRYLGLKEENLTQAGDLLASKYSAPVETGAKPVQSVPESVPTIEKTELEKTTETDCKIN